MEQWTLWTDGQLDSPAWPQWKCIGSAVICKSRSFASQVENWVNAMLGGLDWDRVGDRKAVPKPQTDYMETRSRSGPGWVAGCHGDSDGDVFAMGFCLAASTKYEIQKTTKLQAPHTSSDSNMTHKIPAIHALHSKKNPITWLWCSLTHSSFILYVISAE